MNHWISDWFFNLLNRGLRKKLPKIDWEKTYNEIEEVIDGNNVYLETRLNGLIPIDSQIQNGFENEIVALIVTPAKDGIPAWETEEPAKKIVNDIKNKTNRNSLLFISRDSKYFSGYYAQIK